MITAALLGNPNVGKTSLFNVLTGLNQYVGNWAGVTVEKKEGYLNKDIKIVDLPGIYAMDTFSNEEKISKEFLESDDCDLIINIVDSSKLERNLYLTLQLKKFNKPLLLLLNMIDVADKRGMKIDIKLLEKRLNVKIIPISASKGTGISEVTQFIKKGNFLRPVIENDYQSKDDKEIYNYISSILKDCIKYDYNEENSISDKLDKIILNKFLAYPIFIAIMFLIFKLTFSWVGTPLQQVLSQLISDYMIPLFEGLLKSSSPWFKSLIINGIISGVGSVIVFLPIILTLFLGISFLEDSGYMARSAFIMDRLMRRMGLSGKAFIPMIVGFGCSVPAIMSTRTLESEKDRKMTALLVPLMSCNARLPVYALFASLFFKGKETQIVFSLYILGILIAFLIGIIFKNTIFKKEEDPFIIELPEYKMPEMKNLLLHTVEKGKGFLKKAGTIIFAASVIVWFLSNLGPSGFTNIENSFLSYIGKVISPIFIPLGFAGWQNAVALLTGFMAKEVIVGTLAVIYGSSLTTILPMHFTPLSAYAFLVFVLLYTPCVSVVATMKKEYGNRTAAFSIIYQLCTAYIVSMLFFNVGKLLGF
ncbi:MAG: ferrous iron transport protein B [Bacillota bacterium]|nr:ferrous iron transport protein B [Bacillota bacterium]